MFKNVGSGEGTGDGCILLDVGDNRGLGEDCEGLIDEWDGLGEGLGILGESGLGDGWLQVRDADRSGELCSVPCDDDIGLSLLTSRDILVKMLLIFDACELERKTSKYDIFIHLC